jgi:calcineurin-like phosphoesterase family protein
MLKFKKIISEGNSGRVWISSDTHFGHKNICRGVTNWRTNEDEIPLSSTRDFQTLELMNNTLVDNINYKVGQNDTLILLGDVSFGGFDNIRVFLGRLVCKNIHLILGNHDHHIRDNRDNIRDLFLSVNDYLEVNIDGVNFVMSHYPFQSWNGLNKGVIHLHGHVHLSNTNKWGNGKKLDVGVDGNNLQPYSITEIVHMMDKRKVGSDVINDHHLDDINGIVG